MDNRGYGKVPIGYFMFKGMARADQPMSKPDARSLRALSTVANECGFHFYTGVGQYTGVTATSLEEFAEMLQTISLDSVKFHFERADFQRWIRTIFCDTELAESIGLIGEEYTGENLRQEIINKVKSHITKQNSATIDVAIRLELKPKHPPKHESEQKPTIPS